MGLAFRLAGSVGIGLFGVLSLFACAATNPPNEDLAASRAIAVPRAHTAPSGADTEIDPDCPYLTVEVSTPAVGFDLERSRALREIQRPYMEKFSAQLERVGFKLWEPLSVRLERAGFRELGVWWARLSALRVTNLNAREVVELAEIMAKLTPHDRARAEQIRVESEQATWAVESTVLEIPEPMRIGRPQGDRRIVWSWTMSKFPSVLDGALRVDLFTHHEFSNPRRRIEHINQLKLTTKANFAIRASNDADLAASVFLPHARQLCADMSATLSEEEADLERIRDQLTEEIMRVRERRVEQEKQLEIEVEH
jgi:hypothetical protein